MIVLDTNVVSEVERPQPSAHVQNRLASLVIVNPLADRSRSSMA